MNCRSHAESFSEFDLLSIMIKKLSALGAYIVMVTVNYLAVSLPIAGRSTGDISGSYPNLFAPAGYTFSIWGLIYALLAVYLVYQFSRGEEDLFSRITSMFIPNALLNAAWLFAWHYDLIWLSVFIMAGLVITLVFISETLRSRELTRKERWMVRLPFSVYFGWITVAAIANFIVLMVDLNLYGSILHETTLTVMAIISGAAIGLWCMLRYRTIPYGLVLMWAYGGILSKHLAENGFSGQYPAIIFTAALCMLVFAGFIFSIVVGPGNRQTAG